MRLRRIISLLLLSVYLTSICGYSATVLLCHCPHSQHYKTYHLNYCCSACSHAYKDGIHAEDCCNCKHNHTTDITLYDVTKQVSGVISRAVAECIIPLTDNSFKLFSSAVSRYFNRCKTPLPASPSIGSHLLRAPPVLA